jgi:Spy/CpxP family protein refolding chaperone
MRKFMMCLTAASMLLAIGFVSAQPPRQGRGGGMGGMMMQAGGAGLANVAKVQEELKITDEQKTKLREVSEEQRTKRQEMMNKMREEGGFDREKMQEMAREQAEALDKKVKSILKDDQYKRLEQIKWQQAGVLAFNDKKVQEVLKLTSDQKDKFKGMAEEMQQDMQEIFREAQGNFREAGDKVAALRKEAAEKAMKSLDDKQQTQWKEMLGKPFELKMEDLMQGMGGAGGRGKGDRKGGGKDDAKRKDPPKKIDDLG